ncbi:hypothetical protein O181_007503 [Austropuccinia psidii MF-1]|uniref:DUF7721 domain-containing protein n=1 Tax=Austropuccinia psidii MF-1 TaxID=1389203 RepID=A0A9Q3BMJ9_9BASI|nr:hypothetical protein [Austropuccinia psidii MF-1]
MDNLLNLGKQAYQEYSNQNQSHQSNQHFNSTTSSGQMIDRDGDGIPDFQQAAHHASQHSGNAADSSLFSNAMSFLKSQTQNHGHDEDDDLDEHQIAQAHDRAYNKNQAGSLDANSMGMAAALQAFNQFNSGGGSSGGDRASGGGQSKLIGLAMAQAAKLFDSSGGASGGQKQDAVNSAGKMIMKLMMKQKMGQMMGGGGNSGGLSGLASLAGKFM